MESSEFAMWRTVISLIHIDGVVHKAETDWLKSRLDGLNLNEFQKLTFSEDLHDPQRLESIFKEITSHRDRVRLIDFARVVFSLDGDYSGVEQSTFVNLKRMHESVSADGLSDVHRDLAVSLIKNSKENRKLAEFQEFLEDMNRRESTPFAENNHFIVILNAFLFGNKKVKVFILAVILISIILPRLL